MVFVFQYGSNCSDSEINSEDRMCGDAKFISIAETVDDYELVFDVWSLKRACAASDIVRKQGSKVWGALYDVPDHLMARASANAVGRKSFDSIEGEGGNYKRQIIEVRLPNGNVVSATTYVVIDPRSELKTNIAYVGHIVRGLREREAPSEYIAMVKLAASLNNPDIALEVEGL